MKSTALRVLLLVLLSVITGFAAETHVVVMHTNDIRGHVLAGPDGGGSARLATIVHEVKPDLMQPMQPKWQKLSTNISFMNAGQ